MLAGSSRSGGPDPDGWDCSGWVLGWSVRHAFLIILVQQHLHDSYGSTERCDRRPRVQKGWTPFSKLTSRVLEVHGLDGLTCCSAIWAKGAGAVACTAVETGSSRRPWCAGGAAGGGWVDSKGWRTGEALSARPACPSSCDPRQSFGVPDLLSFHALVLQQRTLLGGSSLLLKPVVDIFQLHRLYPLVQGCSQCSWGTPWRCVPMQLKST